MSAIEKILDQKAGEKKQELNDAAERLKKDFEEFTEQIRETSKIALPVDILGILSKGGWVASNVIEVHEGYGVHLGIGSLNPLHNSLKEYRLPAGKSRVTLIIEKLEDLK